MSREGIEALAGRVRMMLARGTVGAVDDATSAQSLQLEVLADELIDGAERLGGYGFTSVPHAGAEVAILFPGGVRSHALVVGVEDRRYRLRGLKAGEVAIYDDQGQSVRLTRDGIVIETARDLTIRAADVSIAADRVTIAADAIALGGTDARPVARVGDQVAGGVITTGSSTVTAA